MMQETLRFLMIAALYIFALVGVATMLTGCESAKYYECLARDNTRNPCN